MIDYDAVREDAAVAVSEEVAFIVGMAKGETLQALGQKEEGLQLAIEAYREGFPAGSG